MERRKGIPLVALVIFIALLVAIILTCVIILGANKNDKQNRETQTQAIGEQTPPPEEPEDVTLESEDLINADQDVRDAYKLTGNGKLMPNMHYTLQVDLTKLKTTQKII